MRYFNGDNLNFKCIRAYVSNYVLSTLNRMMKDVEIYTHRCKTDEPKNAVKTSNTVSYVTYVVCHLDYMKVALFEQKLSCIKSSKL